MKKVIFKYISICLLTISIVSCDNNLDEKVYSSITEQTYN